MDISEATFVRSKGHGLILQITFTSLITYRTVKRVVY